MSLVKRMTESLNKSTLTEDVNEYTALYNEIVDYVYDYIANSLTNEDVAEHVDGYKAYWCETDGGSEIAYKLNEAALNYAKVAAEGFLANYEEE